MEPIYTDTATRRVSIADPYSDIAVEVAILHRELLARIQAKHSAEQLGEAFRGLDTDWRNS